VAEPVVVVGAGAAGLAASFAIVRAGAQVRLFDCGLSASALCGGAVDDHPWERVTSGSEVVGCDPVASPLSAELEQLLQAFEHWELPSQGRPLVRLATAAGRLRLARGRDRGLLDLSELPDAARIVLPRIGRVEWDAELLAWSLRSDAWARRRRWDFSAIEAPELCDAAERAMPAADLAARHDDPAARQRLSERLGQLVAEERERGRRVDAILTGPWLGAARPWAQEIGQAVGIPVGEVLSAVGQAAGLRFEAARDRLLGSLGVEREPVAVRAIGRAERGLRVDLAQGGGSLGARAAVLAVGGLDAGGICYAPPEWAAELGAAPSAGPAFRLSLEAPVSLQALGQRLDVVGSMQGPTLDEVAWPRGGASGLLEAVGLRCENLRAAAGIYAAGAVLADRPRTLLQAVHSGLRAGSMAALCDRLR